MPRYFFDLDDNGRLSKDEEGSDLDGDDHARREAARLLPEVAKDELPDGESRMFIATVRDAQGGLVYRATLTFRGEWLRAV